MSRNGRYVPTTQDVWLGSARYIVCDDAAIPVCNEAEAKRVLSRVSATCAHNHTTQTVNLRPVDRKAAAAHWLRHAWGQEEHASLIDDRMVSLLPGHLILGNSPLQVEIKRALGRFLD